MLDLVFYAWAFSIQCRILNPTREKPHKLGIEPGLSGPKPNAIPTQPSWLSAVMLSISWRIYDSQLYRSVSQ